MKKETIVFVHQMDRSRKHRLFTVRIETRRREKDLWVPSGARRVYSALDLASPGFVVPDREAFSLAFRSEASLRRQEARFFSPEAEFSLFRISPADLKQFLARCASHGVLCDQEGRILRPEIKESVVADISFQPDGKGLVPVLSLCGNAMDSRDGYAMSSDPVRIFSRGCIYQLKPGVPVSLVNRVITGGMLSPSECESLVAALSPYAGKVNLADPAKTVIRTSPVPVLDFDDTFRFAGLSFLYDSHGPFTAGTGPFVAFEAGTHTEVHRRPEEEAAWQKQLSHWGAVPRVTVPGSWRIPESIRENIFAMARTQGMGLTVKGRPLETRIRVAWDIRMDDREICLGGQVAAADSQTGLTSLLDAYLDGQRWFDLPRGRTGWIPDHLFERLKRLELRGDFRDEDIRFPGHDFAFVQEALGDGSQVSCDSQFSLYLAFRDGVGQGRAGGITPPETLQATLRDYQKTGLTFLSGLYRLGFGGILADDMGLGKTLQVIALILHLKETGDNPLTLLVVPKSLIWNWAAEIQKFAPSLKFAIHSGPGRAKTFDDMPGMDIVITSYGLIRQDINVLSPVPWDLVVLDEAQAIKTPSAKVTEAVKALRAKVRLALTGTPVENRPLDLWSLFDFLNPGIFGDQESFSSMAEARGQEGYQHLGTLVSPFILRRMKAEVCRELPEKTRVVVRCGFEDEQRAFYDGVIADGSQDNTMQILTQLLRLRQAACHPKLVDTSYTGGSGKSEAVLETARSILDSGHKILVFSQFVAHLELIKGLLGAEGFETHTLYGSTRRRQDAVTAFRKSDRPCVFLISLKAGGVGLNLTEAEYVFLLDPWWNIAAENQAADRSHRIGQTRPVTIYRFITIGSVEEKVDRLQRSKQRMAESVLGEGGTGGFSREELLDLL